MHRKGIYAVIASVAALALAVAGCDNPTSGGAGGTHRNQTLSNVEAAIFNPNEGDSQTTVVGLTLWTTELTTEGAPIPPGEGLTLVFLHMTGEDEVNAEDIEVLPDQLSEDEWWVNSVFLELSTGAAETYSAVAGTVTADIASFGDVEDGDTIGVEVSGSITFEAATTDDTLALEFEYKGEAAVQLPDDD